MLDAVKDAVRKSSIHVCIVNCGGCNGCDVEVVALLSPRYDLLQYGIYVQNNPREADVLLLTGAQIHYIRLSAASSILSQTNMEAASMPRAAPMVPALPSRCPRPGIKYSSELRRAIQASAWTSAPRTSSSALPSFFPISQTRAISLTGTTCTV